MADFMTVGDLARRAGVTIRTIQYYDQKGLLTPSAKGPQGQRLYTEDDLQVLFRIITLKYLGLSLSDIAKLPTNISSQMFRGLVSKSQQNLEAQFGSLLERMAKLRSLESAAEGVVSWSQMSQIIEESNFVSSVGDSDRTEKGSRGSALDSGSSADSLHCVIDHAIELMDAQVPSSSMEARDLALSLLAMDKSGLSDVGSLASIQSSMPESHKKGDFGDMVSSVFAYLRDAVSQDDNGSGVSTLGEGCEGLSNERGSRG